MNKTNEFSFVLKPAAGEEITIDYNALEEPENEKNDYYKIGSAL